VITDSSPGCPGSLARGRPERLLKPTGARCRVRVPGWPEPTPAGTARSDASTLPLRMVETFERRDPPPPPPVPPGEDLAAAVTWFAGQFAALQANVERSLLGKSEVVRMALVCLFAEGHLLIDDVPGVGKTSLAKALAASISGSLSRIQFTPDLLPADITGTVVLSDEGRDLVFRPGPVFANIVVADEINRASPKTQSALLEVMEERHVTVDGTTRPVPRPFLVVATQNPVELVGTYDLPEAQIDRFLMRLSVGYPSPEDEVDVVLNHVAGQTPEGVDAITHATTVGQLIEVAHHVHVGRALAGYCVQLTTESRRLPDVRLGASPRGTVALASAAQAHAAADGRAFATADDVKAVAPAVLGHRLLLDDAGDPDGTAPVTLVRELLDRVPVPRQRPPE
jgi:MoxR-like ATPase